MVTVYSTVGRDLVRGVLALIDEDVLALCHGDIGVERIHDRSNVSIDVANLVREVSCATPIAKHVCMS